MAYVVLADAVMLVHFAFLAFVTLGGFLAWRWRWVLVPHVAAVAWGASTVLIGLECPLTAAENGLRRLAGEQGLARGFVDTYLTGVVYPEASLRPLQLLVAGLVSISWVGLARRGHAEAVRPALERHASVSTGYERERTAETARRPG